ncbi:MAG: hypothetical protein JWN62_1358 [Acidimicrobiales bacterium]|nr:hypothetical protein [Acidimicrobiales bacterium]
MAERDVLRGGLCAAASTTPEAHQPRSHFFLAVASLGYSPDVSVTCDSKLRSGDVCGIVAVARCPRCERPCCEAHRGACQCAARPPAVSPADSLKIEAARLAEAKAGAARFAAEWDPNVYGDRFVHDVDSRSMAEFAALMWAYRNQGGRLDGELFLVDGAYGSHVGFTRDTRTDAQIEEQSSHGPWSGDAGRLERARLNRQRAKTAREQRDAFNAKLHRVGRREEGVHFRKGDGDGGSYEVWCLEDGRRVSRYLISVRADDVKYVLAQKLAGH